MIGFRSASTGPVVPFDLTRQHKESSDPLPPPSSVRAEVTFTAAQEDDENDLKETHNDPLRRFHCPALNCAKKLRREEVVPHAQVRHTKEIVSRDNEMRKKNQPPRSSTPL